jgi:hypothetical protein
MQSLPQAAKALIPNFEVLCQGVQTHIQQLRSAQPAPSAPAAAAASSSSSSSLPSSASAAPSSVASSSSAVAAGASSQPKPAAAAGGVAGSSAAQAIEINLDDDNSEEDDGDDDVDMDDGDDDGGDADDDDDDDDDGRWPSEPYAALDLLHQERVLRELQKLIRHAVREQAEPLMLAANGSMAYNRVINFRERPFFAIRRLPPL